MGPRAQAPNAKHIASARCGVWLASPSSVQHYTLFYCYYIRSSCSRRDLRETENRDRAERGSEGGKRECHLAFASRHTRRVTGQASPQHGETICCNNSNIVVEKDHNRHYNNSILSADDCCYCCTRKRRLLQLLYKDIQPVRASGANMRIGAYASVSFVLAVATVLHAWQTRCGQDEGIMLCHRSRGLYRAFEILNMPDQVWVVGRGRASLGLMAKRGGCAGTRCQRSVDIARTKLQNPFTLFPDTFTFQLFSLEALFLPPAYSQDSAFQLHCYSSTFMEFQIQNQTKT